MTAKFTTLLTAAALSLTLAAPAVTAQDMGEQAGMLQTAVANALEREGFETSNVGELTLNEIVEIKGRIAEMEAIYAAHMETPEAQDGLARAVAIAGERHAALLCYEAAAAGCHRRIVADMIRNATGCTVVDL